MFHRRHGALGAQISCLCFAAKCHTQSCLCTQHRYVTVAGESTCAIIHDWDYCWWQDEDFGAKDASYLDDWVFNRVNRLFAEAAKVPEMKAQLSKPKSVFFLHLLGIDTNGHAHKPHSREYLANINKVDRGVKQMVEAFES